MTRITLTSRDALDDLINELRSAKKRSLRTGGTFNVARPADDGNGEVCVSVHLFSASPHIRRPAKGTRT